MTNKPPVAAPGGFDDHIDPGAFRLPDDAAQFGAKKMLAASVRKPRAQEFFRSHPDVAYRADMLLLPVVAEKETLLYAVAPAVQEIVREYMKPYSVILCASKTGQFFLWPIRLVTVGEPRAGWHTWSDSSREAAAQAIKTWVRIVSVNAEQRYDIFLAVGKLAEPTWPTEEFGKVLMVAFKGRYIASTDDPVIKGLFGEI